LGHQRGCWRGIDLEVLWRGHLKERLKGLALLSEKLPATVRD
jgi:hypothetical protein